MHGIIKKLVKRRIQNLKDLFEFRFFEELSRIEILCKHGIIGLILFILSKIFAIKTGLQN